MDAWEILTRFYISDSERVEALCSELTEHHGITVVGVPDAKHLKEISALHGALHRCNGSLRKACQAVAALLREEKNG